MFQWWVAVIFIISGVILLIEVFTGAIKRRVNPLVHRIDQRLRKVFVALQARGIREYGKDSGCLVGIALVLIIGAIVLVVSSLIPVNRQ